MRKYKKKTILILFVLFLFSNFACHSVEAFTFGVEYADPNLPSKDYYKAARMFGQIGVTSIKVQTIKWNLIEPRPPSKKGAHRYDWKKLDQLIKIFQPEGFDDIEIVLESSSSWALRPYTKEELDRPLVINSKRGGRRSDIKKGKYSLPPKQEHWQDYYDFVNSIVERYDGDGVSDMPGLLHPVLEYEIETEAQGSFNWMGSVDEYIRLLQTAYKAAKAANPKTKIILSGFLLGDIPHLKESVPTRIKKVGKMRAKGSMLIENQFIWTEMFSFNKAILKQKDYFDMVEFHSLENYPSIYGTVGWIRKEMKKNGYEKDISIGDTSSIPAFFWGPVTPYPHPFNLTPMQMLEALALKKHPKHHDVYAWLRAEQSRLIVKKTVVGMELGVVKINFGGWRDSPFVDTFIGKLFYKKFPTLYNWGFAGIVSKRYKPHPAFYTYKLTIEKLKNAQFVKRLPLGPGRYGAEFSSGGRPVYVFWSDSVATINFTVAPSFKEAKITGIITRSGQNTPRVVVKKVKDKVVKLDLNSNPIFLEPVF